MLVIFIILSISECSMNANVHFITLYKNGHWMLGVVRNNLNVICCMISISVHYIGKNKFILDMYVITFLHAKEGHLAVVRTFSYMILVHQGVKIYSSSKPWLSICNCKHVNT